MVVKTFRGLLADGGQDRIKLQTSTGKVGYRIVKFQVFPNEPGEQHLEGTVKIYKDFQTTVDNTVNFTDNALLAVAYYQDRYELSYSSSVDVVFEREIFNQDIYVTASDTEGAQPTNYYLELEVIPLASAEAAITTVKAMRGSAVD